MKVNVYETVEVSDEQRVQLAAVLDGQGAKKRIATREELKDFIWGNGKHWAEELTDQFQALGESATDDLDDDDLI